jgi:hypothetical protein
MQASYCTLIAAWAGAIPIWIESLLALILLAGKVYLDGIKAENDEKLPK